VVTSCTVPREQLDCTLQQQRQSFHSPLAPTHLCSEISSRDGMSFRACLPASFFTLGPSALPPGDNFLRFKSPLDPLRDFLRRNCLCFLSASALALLFLPFPEPPSSSSSSLSLPPPPPVLPRSPFRFPQAPPAPLLPPPPLPSPLPPLPPPRPLPLLPPPHSAYPLWDSSFCCSAFSAATIEGETSTGTGMRNAAKTELLPS